MVATTVATIPIVREARTPGAVILLLLPLLVIAAGRPSLEKPERTPPAAVVLDPARHDSIAPGYWLPLLEAPPTPADFALPTAGPRLTYPIRGIQTQPFGCTNFGLEPKTGGCQGGFHYGIDLADPEGTPIRAAAPGIAYPLPDYEVYGNHVLLQHPGGLATVYGHMVRMNVAWGQAVRAGEVIGWVGSTGNSTGPHLHFEVRFAGIAVDPLPYLEGSPPDPFPLPAGWPGLPPDDGLGRA